MGTCWAEYKLGAVHVPLAEFEHALITGLTFSGRTTYPHNSPIELLQASPISVDSCAAFDDIPPCRVNHNTARAHPLPRTIKTQRGSCTRPLVAPCARANPASMPSQRQPLHHQRRKPIKQLKPRARSITIYKVGNCFLFPDESVSGCSMGSNDLRFFASELYC